MIIIEGYVIFQFPIEDMKDIYRKLRISHSNTVYLNNNCGTCQDCKGLSLFFLTTDLHFQSSSGIIFVLLDNPDKILQLQFTYLCNRALHDVLNASTVLASKRSWMTSQCTWKQSRM